LMGHEVVVGNARKLKLITENSQKSDKVDPRLISKLGCVGVEWLHPVYQRSQEAHNDLVIVRSRETLMETRTALINQVRGTVKAFGCRLRKSGAEQFVKVAREGIPAALQSALGGVLAILEELNEQIYGYECAIKQLCEVKHKETQRMMQVSEVGPITA